MTLATITTILKTLKSNKTVQLITTVVLAASLAAFAMSKFKDMRWSKIVESKSQQVQMLEQKIIEKDIKIAELDVKITVASKQTEAAEAVAKKAQAKTNELFKKWKALQDQVNSTTVDPLPTIPVTSDYPDISTVTTLKDCTTLLEKEREQCTEEKTILVEEIIADRDLIAATNVEKALLEEKADVLVSEVVDLKEVKEAQKVIIDTQDKKLDSEVKKKKIYRGASGILALIVTVLLL